jgi:response regulator RpfG family c-di-GMP phosphodiesterase
MGAGGKYAVLVVDDEPDMLFSLRGLLRREFEVFTARGGREAMEVLKEHPVHVIMTDQRMPEMTGVEFLNRAKEQHPDAIRVIFTGYADPKSLMDAINQANVYRFVAKPWDPEELVAVLRAACEAYQRIVTRKALLTELGALRARCGTAAAALGDGGGGAEAARAALEAVPGVVGRAMEALAEGPVRLV